MTLNEAIRNWEEELRKFLGDPDATVTVTSQGYEAPWLAVLTRKGGHTLTTYGLTATQALYLLCGAVMEVLGNTRTAAMEAAIQQVLRAKP